MSESRIRSHTLYVKGMHCPSCVVLTEDKLVELENVHGAKASLSELSVTVTGDFGDTPLEQLAEELSKPLIPHGYSLQREKPAHVVRWKDFRIALPVALLLILLFVALQKMGLVNLIQAGNVSLSTAFVIGVVASLSTCMAVVGGLVLSLSASFSQAGQKITPQLFFHIGRLIAFFVFGGVIGALGSTIVIGRTGTFVLSMLVGLTLLVLGLNLLNIFPWTKRLQPRMPKGMSRRLSGVKKINSTFTPFLVGAVTFFLPCGFTQSMQIYTLTTGSFLTGALTMFVFALGTLPVLSILSFTSASIRTPSAQGVFFKTAGLVVLFFAGLNILSSLIVVGLIPPILNF